MWTWIIVTCVTMLGHLATAAELPKVLIIGDSISIGYTPAVKELLKGQADVASITPVVEPNQRKRLDEDVRTYNAIAQRIMQEEGIAIDDLYAVAKGKEKDLIVKDGVHFTKDGYASLGKSVAGEVEKALNR